MNEHNIRKAVADRAAIERWEDEGGRISVEERPSPRSGDPRSDPSDAIVETRT
jgi:hypothetical protein